MIFQKTTSKLTFCFVPLGYLSWTYGTLELICQRTYFFQNKICLFISCCSSVLPWKREWLEFGNVIWLSPILTISSCAECRYCVWLGDYWSSFNQIVLWWSIKVNLTRHFYQMRLNSKPVLGYLKKNFVSEILRYNQLDLKTWENTFLCVCNTKEFLKYLIYLFWILRKLKPHV